MAKYNNAFQGPKYIEETILDGEKNVIGRIRIKPSSVLWKPTNARKFYSIQLKKFSDWIQHPDTRATKTIR